MAYLEVLSPCVTYNDTYREWRTSVYDMDNETVMIQAIDPLRLGA
ncbi:MAG: hypothetical protein CM1200mP20_09790 [Pseudomonadota bacterium]|nr:MAG: hypothetical protein CM1200mP20_09790 [Pseudomonadota bacterium]